MCVAVEREDAIRCPVVDDRVGVFRRGNPAECFERLQIEHHDGPVVAGGRKSMSRRRGNRRPVRALNARHFAKQRPVVFVDHHHAILPANKQSVSWRVGHDVVPAAVAAERVGMCDPIDRG